MAIKEIKCTIRIPDWVNRYCENLSAVVAESVRQGRDPEEATCFLKDHILELVHKYSEGVIK